MNDLWTWLLIIFVPLAIPFTIAPIIVRFRNSHPAAPEFDPAGVGQLPPDVADSFYRFVYAMNVEGFVFVGYFRQMAYMPGVRFYLALLKNPASSDMVYLMEVFANFGFSRLRTATIEFCTDFSDGTEICTNNGQQPSIHRSHPGMQMFKFPEVANPHVLYRVHRSLCAKLAPGVERVPWTDGDELFRLSYGTVKEVRKQAEFGYYYLDEKKNLFRPTWKGAYLMTWRLAWPVRSFRKSRMNSKARATMKSLGF